MGPERSARARLPSTLVIASVALSLVCSSGAAADGEVLAATRPPAQAKTEDGWELIRDDEGIRTYRKALPGTPLLAFKGEGTIDAPTELVLSVCMDAERAGEWIGLVSESAVLRWVEEGDAFIQFTRFDLPWPVKDRVFVSEIAVEVDAETHRARLVYSETTDSPAIGDAIRGSTAGSRFEMRPIDGGTRTHFTGIGIADPRGAIPTWFVNWAGRSVPHRTLAALRRQVQKDDVSISPVVRSLFERPEVDH